MKKLRKLMFWSPLLVCTVAQLAAAAVDYPKWKVILPDQFLVMLFTTCILCPVHIAEILSGSLLALGFKFERKTRTRLVWNCIKANLLHWGTLIGLIGFFSIIGGMLPWNNGFPWGIISFSCLLVIPPVFSFTYEYIGCRKLLPSTPKERIITFIIVTTFSALLAIILLLLIFLLALLLFGLLKARIS